MIPGLPNPWVILGALGAALALIVGAFFYGEHVDALSWKAKTAALEVSAQQKLGKANDEAAKANEKAANIAREKDETHAKDLQAIDDTRAQFASDLHQRVRDAERRARGSCQLSSAPNDSGKPENRSTGSDDRLSSIDPERLRSAADGAMKLAALVRDVCVPWAKQIGR